MDELTERILAKKAELTALRNTVKLQFEVLENELFLLDQLLAPAPPVPEGLPDSIIPVTEEEIATGIDTPDGTV